MTELNLSTKPFPLQFIPLSSSKISEYLWKTRRNIGEKRQNYTEHLSIQGFFFHGDNHLAGGHSTGTSWVLHQDLAKPILEGPKLLSSPWLWVSSRSCDSGDQWDQKLSYFQSHLLFVHFFLSSSFSGKVFNLQPASHVGPIFRLWVLASRGLVGIARCLKSLIRSVNIPPAASLLPASEASCLSEN